MMDQGISDDLIGLDIAVLVPCFNEVTTIGQVVRSFRANLPHASIFVFDNNSNDHTADAAESAGAIVRREIRRGKGNVVRRMFADVDADVYVLVDGDATYDAPSAPVLIQKLISEQLDMVVATRVHQDSSAYRAGHVAGNWILTRFVSTVFGRAFTDMLSGYRVFSRRFVKSFPLLSSGFEIETELTVHALELGLPTAEIETAYYARPEGSTSKLNTWEDGFRIVRMIFGLYRAERPFPFFGGISGLLALASIVLSLPIVITFLETGLVPRLPTAVLSTGLMILAALSFAVGLILDTVTRGRREMKRLHYLAIKSPRRRGAISQMSAQSQVHSSLVEPDTRC